MIQELLGHSCVESTQFYIHINDDKMKRIMNSHPLANITNISTMKIKEKRGKEMENITLHFTQEQIDVILDSLKIYMNFWENVEKTDNTSINRKALLKYTYAYIQSSSYATNCEKEGEY